MGGGIGGGIGGARAGGALAGGQSALSGGVLTGSIQSQIHADDAALRKARRRESNRKASLHYRSRKTANLTTVMDENVTPPT